MIKIFLADLYHDYQRKGSTTPTNAAFVASYCKEVHKNNVQIKLFKEFDKLFEQALIDPPDILGLANYMWSEALNEHCARKLKKLNPDLVVVSGGPNIRTDPEGVELYLKNNKYVDQYILFGAEVPFSNLVQEFLNNGPQSAKNSSINGCYRLENYKLKGNSFINPEKNLDFIPSPFLNGMLDEFLADGHIPIFETNRGCPFSCTFCVWGIAALGKIKTFSIERVKTEMEYVARNFSNTKSWILADANFGILPRDVEIAKLLRSFYDKYKAFENVNIWWSKTVTPRSYEIAKILGKLTEAYVAFQSLDEKVLKNIKRSNISVDSLNKFKQEVEHYTNGSYTDILLGLPGESKQSHMNSYYGALRLGFDQIGGGEVRLLPGSEMDSKPSREKYALKTKYRISEADVGIYDGDLVYELEEVIRETDAISEKEMLELRIVRAFLFGATTLGELRYLNDILLDKNINILEVFDEMVKQINPDNELGKIVAELDKKSRNEWFDTRSKAKDFLSIKSNLKNIIDNPPIKLNYWLTGKLLTNNNAYLQFQDVLKKVIVDKFDLSEKLVTDLLNISKERNFLFSVLNNDFRFNKSVKICKSTFSMLKKSSYAKIKDDFSSSLNEINLYMNDRKANEIIETIQKSDLSVDLNLTTILQRFRGQYHFNIVENNINKLSMVV